MCDKRSDLMIRNILLDISLPFRHFTLDVDFWKLYLNSDTSQVQNTNQSEKRSVKVTFATCLWYLDHRKKIRYRIELSGAISRLLERNQSFSGPTLLQGTKLKISFNECPRSLSSKKIVIYFVFGLVFSFVKALIFF